MIEGEKTKSRKQKWGIGAVFSVTQPDNYYCLGQIVDMMFPNAPTCVFYDLRFPVGTIPAKIALPHDKIIAAISTTRERLDRGIWQVLGYQAPVLERRYWPNEHFREAGWVGAVTHGAGVVTRFLEAFYGLAPWDYYLDPYCFDELLFTKSKKPKKLIFKKN